MRKIKWYDKILWNSWKKYNRYTKCQHTELALCSLDDGSIWELGKFSNDIKKVFIKKTYDKKIIIWDKKSNVYFYDIWENLDKSWFTGTMERLTSRLRDFKFDKQTIAKKEIALTSLEKTLIKIEQ